jgi:hypothetical protein
MAAGRGRAYHAVHEAVVAGALSAQSATPCAGCGRPAVHYHHPHGYDEAHQLDVTALCASCHRRTHWDGRRGRRDELAFSVRVRPEIAEKVRRNAAAARRSINRELELYVEEAVERREREQERRGDAS